MSVSNVVVVVLDTARADVVAGTAAGGELPAIEALRERGVTAERCFSAAPWTLPSHASLFTGTAPSKHGAHAGHKKLNGALTTLAEVFESNGHETVAVSNNTWISEEFGFARGFETFRKTWQYVQSDVDLGRIARTEEGTDKIRALGRELLRGNPLVNLANTVYGRFVRRQYDDGARQSNEWIGEWLADRAADRPFFLFVNYLEPHLEYRPPEEFATLFLPEDVSYDEAMAVPQDAWGYIARTVEMTPSDFEVLRALYRAEIAYLDHRIGELERLLRAHDEWDDTLLVVTGDHGENIGDHGLMDHQYCLYDTLLHVPLVLHGGAFDGGDTVDEIVQLTDLAPTLLDAAGVDAPGFDEQSQGRSFHPDADADPREYAVAEYLAPQPSMDALAERVGELTDEVKRYDRSLRAIRSRDWKLVRGSDGSRELYDLTDDPAERTDRSAEDPETAAELEAELDEWLQSFDHAETSGSVDMTDATRDRLEDLGYLQ